MDKKRYTLLINTLNSQRYFLKLRDNSIFDRVERKYVDVNKKMWIRNCYIDLQQ